MTKQALRKSVWSFGLIALLGLLVIPTLTVAQDVTGFRGRVVDTTGAVMVGVSITAINESKGLTYSTVTNEVGEYELRGILPDTYTLTAEATGFKRYENTGVIVYSQSPRRVDITMEIGELADAITVTEEGARIETDTPSVTYKTPNKEVYYTNVAASLIYTVGAAPGVQNRNEIHGAYANNVSASQDGILTLAYGTFRFPQEVLQEVHLKTLNAPAEFQHANNIIGVGRSGTNQFHGEIWNDFRHARLIGKNRSLKSRPKPETPNLKWSYEAAGPIWIPKIYDGRNRSFFHFLWQPSSRFTLEINPNLTYPTPLMRTGNLSEVAEFSGLRDASGKGVIMNPYTMTPFPNNTIPSDMFHPLGVRFTELLPLPERPGLTTNRTGINENKGSEEWWHFRFDHQIHESNTISFNHFRYTRNSSETKWDHGPLDCGRVGHDPTRAWSILDSHVFSPSVINEFSIGYNEQLYLIESGCAGSDLLRLIDPQGLIDFGGREGKIPQGFAGAPQITARSIGNLSNISGAFDARLTNALGGGAAGYGSRTDANAVHLKNNISITKGTHLFKMGFSNIWGLDDRYRPTNNVYGRWDFSGNYTGWDYGDILLGLPRSTAIAQARGELSPRSQQFGIFFQDDWKVTPRLTITPGIRFQHYGVPSEVLGDTIYNFDLETARVVVPNDRSMQAIAPNFPIEVVTAGDAGYPSGLRNFKSVLVDPRLGLAFRATDSLVIRGGYGVFHVPFVKSTAWAIANVFGEFDRAGILAGHVWGPYQFSELFQDNEIVNGVPSFTWERPFPAGQVGPTSLTSADVDLRKNNWPYDQQWNITLEKEFGLGWSGRASWVGSRGVSWPYIEDLQAIRPGSSYQPFDPSKFANVHALQLGGNSKYNALQLELTRQFSSGIYFRGWFNWSKSLNDVQGGLFGSSSGFFQSSAGQRHNDYGWQAGVPDLTSRWLAVVPLPFGKGQQFASGASTWLHHLIGDWTLVPQFRTGGRGRFIPVFSGGNHPALKLRGDGARPDLVGGCNPNDTGFEGRGQLWNRGCFALPPESRYGTAPRGALRHPNRWDLHLNIFKEWKLVPSLEQSPYFKLEAYISNLLNHANSGGASTNVADPNFGIVRSGGGNRGITLRARIGF
jgi:hypothetical protein